MPVVKRTRATLRSAEFGFFGVVVKTRVHTPRRCGDPFRAGVLVFVDLLSRPLRTSWAIVGTRNPLKLAESAARPGAKGRPEPTREAIRPLVPAQAAPNTRTCVTEVVDNH